MEYRKVVSLSLPPSLSLIMCMCIQPILWVLVNLSTKDSEVHSKRKLQFQRTTWSRIHGEVHYIEWNNILKKKNNAPWLSVPQFGDWDMKGEVPDYSLDFSKIREMRKQNKRDVSRTSIGNEEELVAPNAAKSNKATVHNDHPDDYHQSHYHNQSPTARRSFFSYFNCCVRA